MLPWTAGQASLVFLKAAKESAGGQGKGCSSKGIRISSRKRVSECGNLGRGQIRDPTAPAPKYPRGNPHRTEAGLEDQEVQSPHCTLPLEHELLGDKAVGSRMPLPLGATHIRTSHQSRKVQQRSAGSAPLEEVAEVGCGAPGNRGRRQPPLQPPLPQAVPRACSQRAPEQGSERSFKLQLRTHTHTHTPLKKLVLKQNLHVPCAKHYFLKYWCRPTRHDPRVAYACFSETVLENDLVPTSSRPPRGDGSAKAISLQKN